MVSCYGIPIQWQKTYGNRKNTIQVKLWKTSIERQSCSTIRDSKSRRVSCKTTEELGTGYKDNKRNTGKYEKTIWQERQNPQGLKVRDNMWLENKNIQSNQPSKKLDNKRYELFRILKDISSEAFQLELPEE